MAKGRGACPVRRVAALALASALGACAGSYGSIRWDQDVARSFEAGRVLPGHRYYSTGSESEPSAILALREDRPLCDGPWREIAATPGLLAKLTREMRGERLVGPDGGAVLDNRGEPIGAWYSYGNPPPPPRITADGCVLISPPHRAIEDWPRPGTRGER